MKRILPLLLTLALLLGLAACSFGFKADDSSIVIPPSTQSKDRDLSTLPAEVEYDDIIGEFSDNYYLSLSQETLELMSRLLGQTCSEMSIAVTPEVSYYRIQADGVLIEVVDEDDATYIRRGGKGSFTTADRDDNAEAYEKMTNGLATMVNGMRLQYSFDRDTFAEVDFEALRFDKVGGRDCIVYSIKYASQIDMLVYLDFDTKVCLKLVDSVNEDVDIDFAVFKTDDFSIPAYK